MQKILLLEDDESLVEGLEYSLGKNGFLVISARTVAAAWERLSAGELFDLLLLDVTLPDGNGFTICERVRDMGNRVPIIFLTAAEEEVNIIRGLDCGGDDYVTKPFKLGELCSRIRALLRRSGMNTAEESNLVSGNVTIDRVHDKVFMRGEPLELTGAEYRLLCLLIENHCRILTRSVILDRLWDGNGSFVENNTLSVYIRRLREKIEEDSSNPKHLLTIRGFGYQWKE